jgi:quinol monooxygenase YgiN
MNATLIVRHSVADFDTFKGVYDTAATLRAQHGCTGDAVMHAPGDRGDILVTHAFPTVAQAEAFAADPALQAAMQQAGVTGPPRIEIFVDA